MADEKSDPPSPAPMGAAQARSAPASAAPDLAAAAKRRRPAPTIDLKATELASEPVNPAQAAGSAQETPKAAEAMAASATAAAANESPPPADPASSAEPPRWGGAARRLRAAAKAAGETVSGLHARAVDRLGFRTLAAAAVSAAATLCVILALWLLAGPSAGDERADALAARMTLLELKIGDLAKAPPKTASELSVPADLAARLAGIEQATGALATLDSRMAKTEQSAGAIAALDARLARLEKAPVAPSGPASNNQFADRIAALERTLSDVKGRADSAFDAAQKNATPSAAMATDHKDIDALTMRLAALEQAAKSADERIARAASGADKAARFAFAALALRGAVERGDPFAAELAAARPLSDGAQIAALEPFAASGVPRAAVLGRELAQLTPLMLNAMGAAPRESGIMDRLQQGAERLVRIRPLNETAGDDPAALITRAEVKAQNGDLTGALADLSRLPDAVRAPAGDWMKKAAAQVAALAAARRLAEGAVGGLGKP
jgi:hypothetical protein